MKAQACLGVFDFVTYPLLLSTRVCAQFRGVLNIVHGTHDTVNRICDHPDIKAISFVGSDGAGRYIYERGGKHGKRVQVRPLPRSAPILSSTPCTCANEL